MVRLTNYTSGELEIVDEAGRCLRLTRDQANRLVMHARMHTVAEFVEALPQFLLEPALREVVLKRFREMATPTDRWHFKEKFARLRTLTHDYAPTDSINVVETVIL